MSHPLDSSFYFGISYRTMKNNHFVSIWKKALQRKRNGKTFKICHIEHTTYT